MLFITLMTKMSDTAEAKYKYDKTLWSWAGCHSRRCAATPSRPYAASISTLRHLPVDVPVAPCSASDESYRLCITLPHTLYQTFVIIVINNIRTRFIIFYYVICAVIYCSLCCIYVWLDPGTYMIARFMSFYKPGVTLRGREGARVRGHRWLQFPERHMT